MQLLSLMKKIGIFMICAQTVIHFRPSKSYEKYLKLLTNMMVLAMLVLSAASFLRSTGDQNYAEAVSKYELLLQEHMPKVQLEDGVTEDTILQLAEQEIRKQMNAAAGTCGYRVVSVTWKRPKQDNVWGYEEDTGQGTAVTVILEGKQTESGERQKLEEMFAKILDIRQDKVEVIVHEF